jgi:putative oxidoreductase
MSFGLLLVRVVLGALLIGLGTQKLFGWFGGSGVVAASASFRRMGYRHPSLAAAAVGLTESGAGALLVLGLLTPPTREPAPQAPATPGRERRAA